MFSRGVLSQPPPPRYRSPVRRPGAPETRRRRSDTPPAALEPRREPLPRVRGSHGDTPLLLRLLLRLLPARSSGAPGPPGGLRGSVRRLKNIRPAEETKSLGGAAESRRRTRRRFTLQTTILARFLASRASAAAAAGSLSAQLGVPPGEQLLQLTAGRPGSRPPGLGGCGPGESRPSLPGLDGGNPGTPLLHCGYFYSSQKYLVARVTSSSRL